MIKFTIFLVYYPLYWLCLTTSSPIKEKVHIFFYLWYGNPTTDGSWRHWNHEVLPHWLPEINSMYPTIGEKYEPPHSIHSPFYPLKGLYSSKDPDTIRQQIFELHNSGVDIIVVSWWGQSSKNYSTDTQGVSTDLIISDLFQIADEQDHNIKISFHLEPYPSRSAESVRDDMEYIIGKYGHHTSFYRNDDNKPMFYIYDSYHIPGAEWARLLQPHGDITIRKTSLDSIVIGLLLERRDLDELITGGFNGIYTYFSSIGFSFGSSPRNWNSICHTCRLNKMYCSLSVGPGYNDTAIRPWNHQNTKDRRNGVYYNEMWEAAIRAKSHFISITSFNEWGEGTQIEPAREYNNDNQYYLTYGDSLETGAQGQGKGPYKYLDLTKKFADDFKKSSVNDGEL